MGKEQSRPEDCRAQVNAVVAHTSADDDDVKRTRSFGLSMPASISCSANQPHAAMQSAQDQLLALHHQLISGREAAGQVLAQQLLPRLLEATRKRLPFVDKDLIFDASVDALLDYLAKPGRFQVSLHVPLDRFLSHNAWKNLCNLHRAEQRRKDRERQAAEDFLKNSVELSPSAGNISMDGNSIPQQQFERAIKLIEDPVDREIFKRWLSGERRTVEFSEIMGLAHLAPLEQRQRVKRAKDRILMKLRRILREAGDGAER